MRAWTAGLVLALSACGGKEPGNNAAAPKPTPGPTLGSVALDKPLRAAGTKPYWAIVIAPGTIAYSGTTDAAPIDFYPVSPTLTEGRAIYTTQTPQAVPVMIALTATPCAAGGASQPLTAEVKIGARVLHGCAGPAPLPRYTPEADGNATKAM